VGGVEYIKEYTSEISNSTHIYYSKLVLLPIFIIWVLSVIFFPILLYKKRHTPFIRDFPPYGNNHKTTAISTDSNKEDSS